MRKAKRKLRILIGSLTKDDFRAIPTITKSFIKNKFLSEKYEFIPHYAKRKYGKTHLAKFNLINLWYLIKHFVSWSVKIIIYRPDIAHYPITSYWNLEKSLLFLKIAGVFGAKKVGHLHGGAFVDFWSNIRELRKKINLNELNRLDVLIVASNYWKKMLQERCNIKTRIEILYNPINKSFETKALKFNDHNSDIILFMGEIDIVKGVLDIIESANVVLNSMECRFFLAGMIQKRGDLNKCKSLIKNYNLKNKVYITGKITEEEKMNLFRKASIFLFPSYFENFPLVAIEAATAGLAIITTPVGALPEFFEHNKSAIYVEPGNTKQIREAVIDLLGNPEKRKRLGKAARRVFEEKLSRNMIMKQLDNVYIEVLKNVRDTPQIHLK